MILSCLKSNTNSEVEPDHGSSGSAGPFDDGAGPSQLPMRSESPPSPSNGAAALDAMEQMEIEEVAERGQPGDERVHIEEEVADGGSSQASSSLQVQAHACKLTSALVCR